MTTKSLPIRFPHLLYLNKTRDERLDCLIQHAVYICECGRWLVNMSNPPNEKLQAYRNAELENTLRAARIYRDYIDYIATLRNRRLNRSKWRIALRYLRRKYKLMIQED